MWSLKERAFAAGLGAMALLMAAPGCSLFSLKPDTPPRGPVFPLREAVSLSYKGRIIAPGAEGEGLHIFVTDLGQVQAIDMSRRSPAWTFSTAHPVSRPVSLGSGRVYVIDDEKELCCLNMEGRLLWRKTLDENASGPPLEAGGLLCLGTEEGNLLALRVEDGGEAWRYRAGQAIRTGATTWTDQRGDTFILCGGDEGVLYFLTMGGLRRGHIACGGRLSTPPLLENDRLYIGTANNEFLCLNLAKRSRVWRVRLTGRPAAEPVADSGRLFVLTAEGLLVCLKKKGGSILWWKTIASRSAFNPVLAGEQVVIASLSTRLVSYNARDGREVGSYVAGRELRSNPVWAEPMLAVHVDDRPSEGGVILFLEKGEDDGQK